VDVEDVLIAVGPPGRRPDDIGPSRSLQPQGRVVHDKSPDVVIGIAWQEAKPQMQKACPGVNRAGL
jgi:hypothetical protein